MCDTFVALSPMTDDGSVIFGKNSDREPNEAQVLEYHPACASAGNGQKQISCTYITIPQVKETYAVLLSRPFWMWGAEMGANEKGVVIGNEAVFTKMPCSKTDGLTGMDLLRLALERSMTSEQALETLVGLLSDYGQGGICGYQDKNLRYHNSYIIADPSTAWVLETAGDLWAALEIKEAYSISNGLTIGEKFDRSHPELINTARSKGWLKKRASFHFANCYSDRLFTTFSACKKRQGRSLALVTAARGKLTIQNALNILRDHDDTGYKPDSHLLMNTVCMHAANGLTRNSNTTGSLVAHLRKKGNTFWATGTATPCTGIFKPIRFADRVLPDTGPSPAQKFDPTTLWWQHEMLHRKVLDDYRSRLPKYIEERNTLEASFIENAYGRDSGNFFPFSEKAFRKSREMTDAWMKKIQTAPIENKTRSGFRRYWKKQNRAAGLKW